MYLIDLKLYSAFCRILPPCMIVSGLADDRFVEIHELDDTRDGCHVKEFLSLLRSSSEGLDQLHYP